MGNSRDSIGLSPVQRSAVIFNDRWGSAAHHARLDADTRFAGSRLSFLSLPGFTNPCNLGNLLI